MAPVVTHGHNKDLRPDLPQLVYVLTVSAGGAVPAAGRVAAGNTNDDTTHVPTRDGLRAMLGRSDFLYVADAKLCSTDAVGHIAGGGGASRLVGCKGTEDIEVSFAEERRERAGAATR